MLRSAKEIYFKDRLNDDNDNPRKNWRLLNDLVTNS